MKNLIKKLTKENKVNYLVDVLGYGMEEIEEMDINDHFDEKEEIVCMAYSGIITGEKADELLS